MTFINGRRAASGPGVPFCTLGIGSIMLLPDIYRPVHSLHGLIALQLVYILAVLQSYVISIVGSHSFAVEDGILTGESVYVQHR